jgi:hypothetical protein
MPACLPCVPCLPFPCGCACGAAELVPRISPRSFSIASSQRYWRQLAQRHNRAAQAQVQAQARSSGACSWVSPVQAHLCMAVVAYKTPYARSKRGLCSGFLADLVPRWQQQQHSACTGMLAPPALSSSSSSSSVSSSSSSYLDFFEFEQMPPALAWSASPRGAVQKQGGSAEKEQGLDDDDDDDDGEEESLWVSVALRKGSFRMPAPPLEIQKPLVSRRVCVCVC